MKSWSLVFCLLLGAGSQASFAQVSGTNPLARFHTDLGDMDVILLQDVAPKTVANFLGYVTRGAYDNSFIHRSPPSFVIQGGGYKFVNNQVTSIPQDPPVVNEFHVSNTRGTLAMAKLAGNPNSATNQFFFNESNNNAANLDIQNGGFTVFGAIINSAGLTTMDTIAAVPIYNAGSPFDQLPLRNYDTHNQIQDPNLVHVIWIKVVPEIVALTPAANTVHVQGRGVANTTYKLEMALSPVASAFMTSVSVTTSSAGDFNYDDTIPGTKKFTG
jgi:cyclophilin family peptidyl-prolyl cis-trans isomerase